MHEIHDYWSDRAKGYSEYNQEEHNDEWYSLWREELESQITAAFPDKEPWQILVRFVLSDVEKTFLEDMSFDVIVSRNVTWSI